MSQGVDVPDEHPQQARAQHQRRVPAGLCAEQPPAGEKHHEHAEETGEHAPQPGRPCMLAEQGVGRRRGPVLQRGFFERLDAVQARRGPVAARHHFARDFGVAPLVRVDQLAIFDVRKPNRREGEQQQEDAGGGSSTEQQRRDDLALLGREDVVGAAGGLDVHHFESDARLVERAREFRPRKAQARSGAQQHDFRL